MDDENFTHNFDEKMCTEQSHFYDTEKEDIDEIENQ